MKFIFHLPVYAFLVFTISAIPEESGQSIYNNQSSLQKLLTSKKISHSAEYQNGVSAFSREEWVKNIYDATSLKYKSNFFKVPFYKDWLKTTIKKTTVNAEVLKKVPYEDWLTQFLNNASLKNVKETFSKTEWIKDIVNRSFPKYGKYFKQSQFPIEEWLNVVLEETASFYNKYFFPILGYTYEGWLKEILKNTPISPGQTYNEFLKNLCEHTSALYKLHIPKFNFDEWCADVLLKTSTNYGKFFKILPFSKEAWITDVLQKTSLTYNKYFETQLGYSYEKWMRATVKKATIIPGLSYEEWLSQFYEYSSLNYKVYLRISNFPYSNWIQDILLKTSNYELYFDNESKFYPDQWVANVISRTPQYSTIFNGSVDYSYEGWLKETVILVPSTDENVKNVYYRDWLMEIIENTPLNYKIYFNTAKFSYDNWLVSVLEETSLKYFKHFKNRHGLPLHIWKKDIFLQTSLKYEIYFKGSVLTYERWLTDTLSNVSNVSAYKKYEDWLRAIIENTSEKYLTHFKQVEFSMESWLRHVFISSSSEYKGFFKNGAGLSKVDWIVDTYKNTSLEYNKYFLDGSGFTFMGFLVDAVGNAPKISYDLMYEEWLQAVIASSSIQYKNYLSKVNFTSTEFIHGILFSTKIDYSLYFKLGTFEYPKDWLTYVLSLNEITIKYKKYFSSAYSYEKWLREIISKTKPLIDKMNYNEWLLSLINNTSMEYKKYLAKQKFPVMYWLNDIYSNTVSKFGEYFVSGKTGIVEKWLNVIMAESSRRYLIFFQNSSEFTYTGWLSNAIDRAPPNFEQTYNDWLRNILDSTGIIFKQYLIASKFPISNWLSDIYNSTANDFVWLFKPGKKTTSEHWLEDVLSSTSSKYNIYFKSSYLSYQQGLSQVVTKAGPISNDLTYDDWLRKLIDSTSAEYKELMIKANFPLNNWIIDINKRTVRKYGWYFKSGSKATTEYWLDDVLNLTSNYGMYFKDESEFSYKSWLLEVLIDSQITKKISYDQWLRQIVDASSPRYRRYLVQFRFPIYKWSQDVYAKTKSKYAWYFKAGYQTFTEYWLETTYSLSGDKYEKYFLDSSELSYKDWLKTILSNAKSVSTDQTYEEWLREILDSTPLIYRNYLIKSRFPIHNWLNNIFKLTCYKFGWYFNGTKGTIDTPKAWLHYVLSISGDNYTSLFKNEFSYEKWLLSALIKTKPISMEITYTDWLTSILDGTSLIYKQYLIEIKFPTEKWLRDIYNETKSKFGWFFKPEKSIRDILMLEILTLTSSTYAIYFKNSGTSYSSWINEIFTNGPEISHELTYREWLEKLVMETPPEHKNHIETNGMSLDNWLNDVYSNSFSKFGIYFKQELDPFTQNIYSQMLPILLSKYQQYFEGTNLTLENGLKECLVGAKAYFAEQTYLEWLKSIPKSCSLDYKAFSKRVNFPVDEMINLIYTETLSRYEQFFKSDLNTFNEEFLQDALDAIGLSCGLHFDKRSGFSLEAGIRIALSKTNANFEHQTYSDFINTIFANTSSTYIEYMKEINFPTQECSKLLYSKTVSKYSRFFKEELEGFKKEWLKIILDVSPDKFYKFFKEDSGLSYEVGVRIALMNVKLMFDKQTYRQWLKSLTESVSIEYKESDFPVEEWIDFIFDETFTYFNLFKKELSIFSHNWILDVVKLTSNKCGKQFVKGSGFSFDGGLVGAIKYAEPKFNKQTYKDWILTIVENLPVRYKKYHLKINYPLVDCADYVYEMTKPKYATYFKQESGNFLEEWLEHILLISTDKFEKYYESVGTLSYQTGLTEAVMKIKPSFSEDTYEDFLTNVVQNLSPKYVEYLKEINFDVTIWISYIYNESVTKFGSYFKEDMSIFTKMFMIDELVLTKSLVEPYFPQGSGHSYEATLRHALKNSEPKFNTETFKNWFNRAVGSRSTADIRFMNGNGFPLEEIVNLIYMETKYKYAPHFKQSSINFIENWIDDVYFLTSNKFDELYENSNLTYIEELKYTALNTPPKFLEQTYREWLTAYTLNLPNEYKRFLENINYDKNIWVNFVYQETIQEYNSYFKEELTIYSQSWIRDVMLVSSDICGRYFENGSGFSYSGVLRSSTMNVEPAYKEQTYKDWILTAIENDPQEYKDFMSAIEFPINECVEFIYDETVSIYEPLFKQIPTDDFKLKWLENILRTSSSKYSHVFTSEIQEFGLSYPGALIDALSKADPISFDKQTYIEWLYSLVGNLSTIYKLYLTQVKFDVDEYINFIYNESVLKYGNYFKSSLNIFSQIFIRDTYIIGKDTYGRYFKSGTGISFHGILVQSLQLSPPIYGTQTYKSWIQSAFNNHNPNILKYLDFIKFPLDNFVNYIYEETLSKYGPLFKQESINFDTQWLNYVLKISSHKYDPLFSKSELNYDASVKKALEASKPILFDQTYKQWLRHLVNSITPEYVIYLNSINFNLNNWINFIYSNTVSKFRSFFKENLSFFNEYFARDILLLSDAKCGQYFKKDNEFSYESSIRTILEQNTPNFKSQTYNEWLTQLQNDITEISPELSTYLKKIDFPLEECAELIFNETYSIYNSYFKPELDEFSKHWLNDVLSFSSVEYSKYFNDGSGLSYESGLRDALSKTTPNYNEQTYRQWLKSIEDNASPEYKEHSSAVHFPVKEWLAYIYNKTNIRYSGYFKKELNTFEEYWMDTVLLISFKKYDKYFPEGSGLTYEDALSCALTKAIPNFAQQTYKQWLYLIVESAPLKYKQNAIETNFSVEKWIDYIYSETFGQFSIYFKQDLSNFALNWLNNAITVSSAKYSTYFTVKSGLTYEGFLVDSLSHGEPIFDKQSYKRWLHILVESQSNIYKTYMNQVGFPTTQWINFIYGETVTKYEFYFKQDLSSFSSYWVGDILSNFKKYNTYFVLGSGFSYEAGLREALTISEPNFHEQTYKQWLQCLIDARSPEYKRYNTENNFPIREWTDNIYNSTVDKYGSYFKIEDNFLVNSSNKDFELSVKIWIADIVARTSVEFSHYFQTGGGFSYEGWLKSSTANIVTSIKNPLRIVYKKWLSLVVNNTNPYYKSYLKIVRFPYSNWVKFIHEHTATDYEGSIIAPGK